MIQSNVDPNKGLYRGYTGIMEKKMETAIQGLGFRVSCRPLITKPPPFKGLEIRIPILIPIHEKGAMNYESKP